MNDQNEHQIRHHAKAWDGAGLPPPGTICWFSSSKNDEDSPWNPRLNWRGCKVEILAHFEPCQGDGTVVAVFAFDCTDGSPGREVEQAIASCFRPLAPTAAEFATLQQRYDELFAAYTEVCRDFGALKAAINAKDGKAINAHLASKL